MLFLVSFVTLGVIGGIGANAKTVGFIDEVRLLNKIMGANLNPLSQGNTITIERENFIYVILTDVPIDLPSILCQSRLGVYYSHEYRQDLYRLVTITCILIHLGFYLPTPFIKLRVHLAFGSITLRKCRHN